MTDNTKPASPIQIEAVEVDLSHQQTAAKSSSNNPRLTMLLIAGGGIALVVGALLLLPKWIAPVPASQAPGQTTAVDSSAEPQSAASPADPKLAPFAASQKQLARSRAEEDLKVFVELQLALEETMSVGEWGQQDYDAALDLAAQGDEAFLREDFATAIATYSEAAQKLTTLISNGETLVAQQIAKGEAAIVARDATAAVAAFDLALEIEKSNKSAQVGRERALLLPEIIGLERQARNQELSEDWAGARASYEEIAKLDPQTTGLQERLAAVSTGSDDLLVKAELTKAFAALESRQYSRARESFNAALRIDPGNSVAAGGLEQIRQETEIGKIDRLRQASAQAAANEHWQEALDLYKQALAIDVNIAFARQGLEQAQQQQRSLAVLERIIANPDKLSSDNLLNDGQRVVDEAKTLRQQGPKLKAKLESVEALLVAYSTPVEVTIHSDSQTKVVLSSVGELGSFSNKTVSLRPGAYTLIGSRDGCRDVREKVTVRPGMAPLDIRCREQL